MALSGGEDGELQEALRSLGLEVVDGGDDGGPRPRAQIRWDGRALAMAVRGASQVTGARARELVADDVAHAELIVADRITSDARALLSAAG